MAGLAVRIRRAREGDVPAITEIYNSAVVTTTGTFDTEPRSVDDRLAWFRSHGRRHPVVVAEVGTDLVGWGAVSPWSERKAYDGTGEVSVYVADAHRGRRVGSRLLEALVQAAVDQQFETLLARIAEGNAASLRLHLSAGFTEAGALRGVGRKFGRRLDVHLLQRMLGTPEDRPQ